MIRPLLLVLVSLPLIFGAPAQAQPAPLGALPPCSQAQHDRYVATGPDGQVYPTWHPLIDHGQGCIHSHEHGSDPALVMPGYRPLFGVAARAHGMDEAHAGFKGYAFELDGRQWYLVQHQGTANAAKAACLESHTLDITIWQAGVLQAQLALMPSFGRARINETNAEITGCPQTSASGGVRLFPDASGRNVGYEPWRVGGGAALPFLRWGDLTFNTLNPQTACADTACLAAVPRTDATGPARGTARLLKFEGNNEFWLRATPEHVGAFVVGGVPQYLAPGLDLHVAAAECWPFTAAMLYQCRRDTTLRPLVDQVQYMRWPVSGPN